MYLKKLWFFIILGFTLVNFAIALDSSKSIKQYNHTAWRYEDGLIQNSVLGIVQTRDGYIWLGTYGGLVQFDGVKFTLFDKTTTPELRHNRINSLLESKDGNLWIGTPDGLTCKRGHTFSTYTTKDRLSNNSIIWLYEDVKENLWIVTQNGGLSVWNNNKFKTYTEKDGLPANNLTYIHGQDDGTIYIGSNNGLIKFSNGVFTLIGKKDGLLDVTIRTIYIDTNKDIWVGTNIGMSRFHKGRWKNYTAKNGFTDSWVRCIYKDKDGNLWLGTNTGLFRMKNDSFLSYTASDGLSGNQVTAFCEDTERNFWVATLNGGIDRFNIGKVRMLGDLNGLNRSEIRPILQAHDGTFWIGSNRDGLIHYSNRVLKVYTKKLGLPSDGIRTICEDNDGSLWVGTSGTGFFLLKNEKFTTWTIKDGLADNFIYGMHLDNDKTLWIGTRGGGLSAFKNGVFRTYTQEDGVADNIVRTIIPAKKGGLWIATEGGLTRYKDNAFTSFTQNNGLSNNIIYSLYEDEDTTLWIGTYGGGLNRMRQGSFISYTTDDGLSENNLFQIVEDRNNNLWITGNHGIFRLNKQELNDFADKKITRIHSTVYGTTDGLHASKCNGSAQPAGILAKDGKLWIPTFEGVAIIDSESSGTKIFPPPVAIEKIIFDKKEYPVDSAITFAPGQGNLEFHYTALNYTSPQRIYFKYMLVGYDTEWVATASRRVAYYTNISPGTYTFKVIACNNEGVWNTKGRSIQIILTPHYYQTSWFLSLCILTALGIIFGIYRLRVAVLRKREAELLRLVDERTKHLQQEIVERKEAEEALRESEERYRQLINYSPDAIIVHCDGKFVFLNPAAVRLFGAANESDLIGKSVLEVVHPDDLEKVRQRIYSAAIERKALPPMEEKFIRTDGSIVETEVVSIPIIYQGKPATQVVARDITEQKKLQEQVLQAQRIQGIGTLAGGIAHDFNNILAIIMGYASLLEKRREFPEKHSESVKIIQKTAERGALLVRQILTFARKTNISFELINLHELISELISMLQQTFPKTIIFREEYSHDIKEVAADRTQIHQALLNLSVNARDAMPNGGVLIFKTELLSVDRIKETYKQAQDNQYVCLSVIDTGTGIEESIRQHIFDPFFTTKEKGQGTGLGLSVVYGVMNAHHGFVDIKSEVGVGTTFSLFFPVQQKIYTPPESIPLFEKDEIIDGVGTVLLVEDEEMLLDILHTLLESKGYTVYTAADGLEAIEVFQRHKDSIDVVVSDIGLPKLNGTDVFKRLKEIKPDVSVILASGFFEPDLRTNLQESGLKGFIQKPYLPDQVLQKVNEALRSKT